MAFKPPSAVAPTAENYFTLFLKGLGLPVTQANLFALYGVAQLEGWNNRYNPLNVIQPEPGSTDFNSVGVQSYADFDSGVQGAVTLFSGSHWAGVREALARGNDAQGVLQAFTAAYTWDPGVHFSLGNASMGDIRIGGKPGSGTVPQAQANRIAGGDGNNGSFPSKADYESVDSLGNLLKSIPQLRHLVNEAQANGWSINRFENEVQNSQWWKTHSDTARAVLIQQANDPASYAQTLHQTVQHLRDLAGQTGFGGLNRNQLVNIAERAMLTGQTSSDSALTQMLSNHEDYDHLSNLNHLQGQMAGTASQLQQLASDYGVKWTPTQFALHAQDVVDGTTTIDTFQRRLLDQAISLFPGFTKQLQEGRTVAQLADPYVQSMSQILELNPGKLDTYTPMIRQAMQGSRDKSGDWTPTSLIDFERQLRSDPRYWNTQGATDTVSSALLKLGQDWGFGPEG